MNTKVMNALVYTATREMSYRKEPLPQPREGDVRVEIVASAICGSDMHAYHGKDSRRVAPLILGHEVSGVVMDGKFAGQMMVINPLMTCGECRDCLAGRSNLCLQRELIGMYLPGAFAEQVAISERNLLPVPEGMNPVHASITEPTATGLHAVALVERVLTRPLSEARTLVIGGGAIGLLTALILKAKGCVAIDLAETNALRRHNIEQQGAVNCFDPLADGGPAEDSYDVVFDCVGAGATRLSACAAVRPGGIISHIGLQDANAGLDIRKITLQEITLLGNYCYSKADMLAAIDMLHLGQLGNLNWIDVRPLSAGARAFDDLHSGNVGAAKIVLQPDSLY